MDTLVVRIPADGKTAEGLYSDIFPWDKVGELDIRRASDVSSTMISKDGKYFCGMKTRL